MSPVILLKVQIQAHRPHYADPTFRLPFAMTGSLDVTQPLYPISSDFRNDSDYQDGTGSADAGYPSL